MLQVTSTWTTVPAVNGLQPLSAVGKNHLKKLPTDERTLVEVQFSSVEIQHTNGEGKKKKKREFEHTGEGKRNSLTLLISPLPPNGKTEGREIMAMIFPMVESESK